MVHLYKLKICIPLSILVIVVLYLLLPIGGDYSVNDIYLTTNTKSGFSRLSAEEFEEKVDVNINPTVSNIVLPATMVKRNGRVEQAGLWITGAQVYSSGGYHSAIDVQSNPRTTKSLCPTGNYNCDDVALIAPVSGTISKLTRQNSSHYNSGNSLYNTNVTISGEGQWTGYDFRSLHLWSINPELKLGGKINQGDFLGFMCSQGNSKGPHLHFEVLNGTASVRLSDYIDKIVLHSTVKELTLAGSVYPSFSKLVGFTEGQLEGVNSRPKYDSKVVIK